MDRKQSLFVAVFVATAAFGVAFAYPSFDATRVLWYYPLEHRWALQVKPTALAMDWYGRSALAAAVGLAGFGISYFAGRRLKPLSPKAFYLWPVWAASAILFAMGLYASQLAARHPMAEPLPTWYLPK